MPLNPPLCLLVYYTNIGVDQNNPNLYSVTLSVTPQGIGIPGTGTTPYQYDGTSITVGMYTTSANDGYVFRIHSITSITASLVVLILEDIDGYNAIIDPTKGLVGGGPIYGNNGYIFELNNAMLPVLTAADNMPSLAYYNSILSRFLYFQTQSPAQV